MSGPPGILAYPAPALEADCNPNLDHPEFYRRILRCRRRRPIFTTRNSTVRRSRILRCRRVGRVGGCRDRILRCRRRRPSLVSRLGRRGRSLGSRRRAEFRGCPAARRRPAARWLPTSACSLAHRAAGPRLAARPAARRSRERWRLSPTGPSMSCKAFPTASPTPPASCPAASRRAQAPRRLPLPIHRSAIRAHAGWLGRATASSANAETAPIHRTSSSWRGLPKSPAAKNVSSI